LLLLLLLQLLVMVLINGAGSVGTKRSSSRIQASIKYLSTVTAKTLYGCHQHVTRGATACITGMINSTLDRIQVINQVIVSCEFVAAVGEISKKNKRSM
jgi:hypothetical protein